VTVDLSEPELRSLEHYLGVAQDASSGGFVKVVAVAGGFSGRLMTWPEAMTFAQEAGGRLPTARELISVARFSPGFFLRVPTVSSFWTSDASADRSHAAIVLPARGEIHSRAVSQLQGALAIRTVPCVEVRAGSKAMPGRGWEPAPMAT